MCLSSTTILKLAFKPQEIFSFDKTILKSLDSMYCDEIEADEIQYGRAHALMWSVSIWKVYSYISSFVSQTSNFYLGKATYKLILPAVF